GQRWLPGRKSKLPYKKPYVNAKMETLLGPVHLADDLPRLGPLAPVELEFLGGVVLLDAPLVGQRAHQRLGQAHEARVVGLVDDQAVVAALRRAVGVDVELVAVVVARMHGIADQEHGEGVDHAELARPGDPVDGRGGYEHGAFLAALHGRPHRQVLAPQIERRRRLPRRAARRRSGGRRLAGARPSPLAQPGAGPGGLPRAGLSRPGPGPAPLALALA